jgi:hypothetical protein
MRKLTKEQLRYLAVLAATPSPTIFSWMSRRNGRLVSAFGPPENWTVSRITTVAKIDGKRRVLATASLNREAHFDLLERGYTAACAITPSGLADLQEQTNG